MSLRLLAHLYPAQFCLDLILLAQLLVIHQAFDMTWKLCLRCSAGYSHPLIIEILKSLSEDTDLPRLDHLGGGIKQGGGCSPWLSPDPVSRIQALSRASTILSMTLC